MRKNTQAGFSLVELMVVVAIIGILAMVAIPKVNKFIAKARQTEAQVNLASIYTFNKNFYVEFQGYTNDFTALGYSPEGNLRYNVGFTQAAAGPANYIALKGGAFSGMTTTLAACPSNGTTCKTLNGATNLPPPAPIGTSLAGDFSAFTAGGVAVLTKSAGNDVWTIDQNKNMMNTADGTGN